jgi:hypothetical protein
MGIRNAEEAGESGRCLGSDAEIRQNGFAALSRIGSRPDNQYDGAELKEKEMLEIRKSILVVCGFILAIGLQSALGQDTELALRDKRITIHMTQKPLYTVFWRLIQKYDVPIGLEESSLDTDHEHYDFATNVLPRDIMPIYKEQDPSVPPFSEHLITVNFDEARLDDVMDSIVKQMQNYDWDVSDGVINIFPIRGRDERLKSFLDVKVERFAVGAGDEVGAFQARMMLFLPEFKKFVAENKLEATTLRNDYTGGILPDGMVFRDKTFKELLNAIVKSKRGGWILHIKRLRMKKGEPRKEFIRILI